MCVSLASVLARKIEYLNIAIYCVMILYAGERNVTIKTSKKVLKMPIICKIARETPLLVGGSYTGISPHHGAESCGSRYSHPDFFLLPHLDKFNWANSLGGKFLQHVHASKQVCTLVFGLHVLSKSTVRQLL